MQVSKHANMQVSNYANMQVMYKYASMNICKCVSIQVCKCVSVQVLVWSKGELKGELKCCPAQYNLLSILNISQDLKNFFA